MPSGELQTVVENEFLQMLNDKEGFAGILGESPSATAKSPKLWNAAYNELGMNFAYAAFDVKPDNLMQFFSAARHVEELRGFSITMPYKIKALEHLDELEDKARVIGAVNLVVKDANCRLKGYNTDGSGGIESLTKSYPGREQPFLKNLEGANVLLLGAGGAGRAVGVYLAESVGKGMIFIANRSYEHAKSLAETLQENFKKLAVAYAAEGSCIKEAIGKVDIVVNASIKGQAGWRRVDGGIGRMDAYSSLSPAFPEGIEEENDKFFFERNDDDIARNLKESLRNVCAANAYAKFFDVIYNPTVTPMLYHASLVGRKTMNGKGMNVLQAVAAFMLVHPEADKQKVSEAMFREW